MLLFLRVSAQDVSLFDPISTIDAKVKSTEIIIDIEIDENVRNILA